MQDAALEQDVDVVQVPVEAGGDRVDVVLGLELAVWERGGALTGGEEREGVGEGVGEGVEEV